MNPVTTLAPLQLDPLAFELFGSRLIEASAGTGKTYTIAALYLRLVLGHGGERAYRRALVPPEILVVTFTDAATKELRDRIRARLAEAATYFLGAEAADAAPDALLQALRADTPAHEWPACARRLQLAAEWMDEAAVSTIHGWCKRMLSEHAFDSGSLFTQTLETDRSELCTEVARDYWRSFMVPLPPALAGEVKAWWSGPAALLDSLAALLGHAALLPATAAPEELLASARAERERRLAELKAPWPAWADEFEALLDEAVRSKQVNGQKLKAAHYKGWLEKLRLWARDASAVKPELTDSAWWRLGREGLADAWKDGAPPAHAAIDAIGRLPGELASLPCARTDLLAHAARWIADRLDSESRRRAQMGFDDLLTRLDAALAGPNGGRLAQRIRQSFPVALIDEFQDTDPLQYRIFDAIYGVAGNDPATALVLIGDPKQAIYSFRGADIHTYLVARRACAGRLYTLKRNFRSTAAMVAATNRCFEHAETRPAGEGAFLFRRGADNPLPFFAADAQGRKSALRVNGAALPALTACCLAAPEGKALGKEDYRARIAEVCASEMLRLLNLGQRGGALFAGEGEQGALRPADMAVLVNSRAEADAIRAALAGRGVRSVYLSDRDSVFSTREAAELQHWLAACAEPDEPRLLRAALATPTLALGWSELDRLNRDEQAWEARVLQFRDYRECWPRQGVLPMLRHLMNDFALPARLIARGDAGAAGPGSGERVLTDLLHLAELLQQASALLDGEHALIRHLAEQRRQAAGGDARQVRLESDADLVQVVTIHKSKGLEYPLVFLPFAASCRETRPDDLPLRTHDDQGRLQLALAADAGLLARADRERLGEDLRKLYVALTRARHATWVGLAAVKDLEKSAFGYLLGGGETIAPERLADALAALRGDCADIRIQHDAEPTDERSLARGLGALPGAARSVTRSAREHWWIASYSALRDAAAGQAAAETPTEDVFREARGLPEEPPAPRPAAPSAGALHDFPRGAEAGTFLHDLLEWAAGQGFGALAANPGLLREAVGQRCRARGWGEHAERLCAWLTHFLTREWPLPGAGARPFALAGVDAARAEMEFWVEAHQLDAQRLDRLVCAHTLDAEARPRLQANRVNGMLKGFIDLVFEHQGRYYVADYKSNWLGPIDAAYSREAMRAAILHSRYELQYVLYLFALHRLLKARLPGYDYDTHVGGAAYLFLRGAAADSGGLHFERPPKALIEALDALFAGTREAA